MRASKNVVPSPLPDRVLPPENAKAALLGVAPVVIAENMKDGQEPDAAAINHTWIEHFCRCGDLPLRHPLPP